jgi:glycosyltransferase involved in cell wall biosynthesis
MTVSVSIAAEQLRRRVPGGIGTYTRGLLKGLGELESQERPHIGLVASRAATRPDPLASFGYPLRSSWLPGPLLTRAWDMGLLRAGRGSDIVHSVSLAAPVAAKGSLLVVTVHDVAWRSMPEAFPERGRRWHEAALGRAAKRAAAVVVPSSATAEALFATGVAISEERVFIVPEGADHLGPPDGQGAEALLARLGVKGDYLLTVSTLEPRKNLARLVQAYGLARPGLPEPWPLLIVGPNGWGPSAERSGLGATKGVVFAGAIDGAVLAAVYAKARCLAYVPLVEGFGLPVVEAMAQGTPVVSSAVPSSAGASLEVDPTDIAAIAAGLRAAAGEEATRAALVARGLARAGKLCWVDTARAHVGIWEQVAAGGRARR